MIKVVLDSNVLISALVFKGLPWQVVSAGFREIYQPIYSHFIAEEVKRGLVKLGHTNDEAEILLTAYESVAELVYLADIKPVSRDPKDDPILATALAGKADYIVTGDKDLLVLEKYKRIVIINPANFIKI